MIGFLIWFLVVCCVLAVVIVLAKWVLGLAGIAIPQPVALALSIIVFLILLLALWHFVGATAFDGPSLHTLR